MADLWDEATALPALLRATQRAALGKRHQPEVARFLMDRERLCLRLRDLLRRGAFTPGAPRSFPLFDPKPRTITVLPFVDRVVHHALCAVAEPHFERFAIFDSYACRTGKGQHAAISRALRFARCSPWAWKGDIAAFFASIPHDPLLALVRRRLPCAKLCDSIERIVRALPTAPGRGLPIGSLTSQHLANLYLGLLDHHVKDDLGVRRYLRYMDDFVLFGERAQVQVWRDDVAAFVEGRMGLRLSARGCQMAPLRDGVPLLGWRIYPALLRLRPDRLRHFRAAEHAIAAALDRGELTQERAAATQTSRWAHITWASTFRLRGPFVRSQIGSGVGAGRSRPQARLSRRLLLERGPQRAGGEPQQELARQRERQPPCQGVDQVRVQCLAGLIPGGTEAPRPGGGLLVGVAAGPLLPARESGRRPPWPG